MPLVRVGRIDRTHGAHGEVRIVGESDGIDVLANRPYWLIGFAPESVLHVRVTPSHASKSTKGSMVVRVACADTPEQAERLRGASVFVPSNELGDSPKGSAIDLMGFRVFDEDGGQLGTVKEYLEMPAQDLIVVVRSDGSEVLIPNTSAIVERVDTDARELTVHVIDGLLDL